MSLLLSTSFLLWFSFMDLIAEEKPKAPEIISNATPSNPADMNKLSSNQPELTTFVILIEKAQLKDLLNGTGPFTVFAPSNEAFKKLGDDKVKNLMKPENIDRLSDVLIYHIVPGKYLSQHLKSNELPSINGKKVKIENENGELKINGAKVIKTDISGPNGVIHIVDEVLVP